MGRWTMLTYPAKDGEALSGTFSDEDRRFRLFVLSDMLVKAEAAVAEAQRDLDAEIANARRDGQQRLVDDALKALAERRPRRTT